MADTKKTKSDDEGAPLSYDWHQFNDRHPDPDLAEAPRAVVSREAAEDTRDEDERPHETPENECETCGLDRDALVHQVDDSGNPTAEAQAAADRGDSKL